MKERFEQLRRWMESREGEHLEFKEDKGRFDFEELVKYCCALANERGGRIVLGVTDKRPRRVVGSAAFRTLERTTAGLVDRLHLRVEVEELAHPDGRVVIFHVPGRPVGMPVQYKGAYWMRGGDGLVPMTPDMLHEFSPRRSQISPRWFAPAPGWKTSTPPPSTCSGLDGRRRVVVRSLQESRRRSYSKTPSFL
jgi:predicted HTH transcriptional regulator